MADKAAGPKRTIAQIRSAQADRVAWFTSVQFRPDDKPFFEHMIADGDVLLNTLDKVMSLVRGAIGADPVDRASLERLVAAWDASNGTPAPQAPADPHDVPDESAQAPQVIQPGEYAVPPGEHQHSKCRSCGAPTLWIRTKQGNAMPLDIGTMRVLPSGQQVAMNHFATCPQGQTWSGRGRTHARH